jgi:hypothetical protein
MTVDGSICDEGTVIVRIPGMKYCHQVIRKAIVERLET